MQRAPYIQIAIEDISETDERVRIVGVCVYVDRTKKSIVVDDKTGHIKVNMREGIEDLENLMGKTVRVLGMVITYPDTGTLEISADLIQRFSVDFEKYLAVRQREIKFTDRSG